MAAAGALFTDLNEFKELLAVKNSNISKDAVLQIFLNGVCEEIFRILGQKFDVKVYTETFDVKPRSRVFAVPAAPIHQVISIKSDSDREFATAEEIDAGDYDVETDRDIGFITIDQVVPQIGAGALQIEWLGGFAFDRDEYISRLSTPPGVPSTGDIYLTTDTPTGAWAANPDELATWGGAAWTFQKSLVKARETHPDILLAVYQQAAYLWRTRHLQGTQQATFKNASLMVRSLGLINPVWEVIKQKRRIATKVQ